MSLTNFWYGWKPSWLVELLSGLLVAAVSTLVAAGVAWVIGELRGEVVWPLAVLVGVTMSLVYEVFVDPNRGNPTHDGEKDIAQRAVGMVIGYAVLGLLF